jgi:hypothetical protein
MRGALWWRVLALRGVSASVMGGPAELVATTEDLDVAGRVAQVLAGQGPLSAGVTERLVELLANAQDFNDTFPVTEVLADQQLPVTVIDRLTELVDSIDRLLGVYTSRSACPGQLPTSITIVMSVASTAAEVLARQQLSETVTDTLVELARQGNAAAYEALWYG